MSREILTNIFGLLTYERLGRGICASIILIGVLVFATTSWATEGGGTAAPIGADDCKAGMLPPPGFYYLDALVSYRADQFKGNNGKDLKDPMGQKIDFKVDVLANLSRLIWVTKKKVFGADYGTQLVVTGVYEHVRLGGASDSKVGLADISWSPLLLGWHFGKNLHVVGELTLFAPTGRYDVDDSGNPELGNISRHYWSFLPILNVSYLSDSGIEATGKFVYIVNTKNPKTDYLSGQEFYVEWALSKMLSPSWQAGIQGDFYWQLTDDKQNGHKVDGPVFRDGFKGQAYALGPIVWYSHKNMLFALKYQWELGVKNRSEGERAILKFCYAF